MRRGGTPNGPVAWLPTIGDWEAARPLFNPRDPVHPSWDMVREFMLAMLHVRATDVGNLGLLILSPLAVAKATADEIGADIATERGRAAVAVALTPIARKGIKMRRVLGIHQDIGSRQNRQSGQTLGWALIDEVQRPYGECFVAEVILGSDSPL